MLKEIKGRIAWIFDEENYDIDLIVGVENIKIKDIEMLKKVCMTSYDPEFPNVVKKGDVLVGGKNCGFGHPHFPSFKALRALGIEAVFAESFSPGFYKGEIGNGFPLIECPGVLNHVSRWDEVSFDWDTEKLTINNDVVLQCNKIPQRSRDLIEFGGLIPYIKNKRL
jgi:3-isopropylmalate/(R)-2-methylmalate dehydratase small subunit